jgi:hypothetical protein
MGERLHFYARSIKLRRSVTAWPNPHCDADQCEFLRVAARLSRASKTADAIAALIVSDGCAFALSELSSSAAHIL